jgi:hypothetical protein
MKKELAEELTQKCLGTRDTISDAIPERFKGEGTIVSVAEEASAIERRGKEPAYWVPVEINFGPKKGVLTTNAFKVVRLTADWGSNKAADRLAKLKKGQKVVIENHIFTEVPAETSVTGEAYTRKKLVGSIEL